MATQYLWDVVSPLLHNGVEPGQHEQRLRTHGRASAADELRTPRLVRALDILLDSGRGLRVGMSTGSERRHRGNTIICRAVTSILSQRLLHKMKNQRAVFIARIHACLTSKLGQETQYLASILSDIRSLNAFVAT